MTSYCYEEESDSIYKTKLPHLSDFRVHYVIGKGTYGRVYKVSSRLGPLSRKDITPHNHSCESDDARWPVYALKVIKKDARNRHLETAVLPEFRAFHILNNDCQYIVNFLGSFQTEMYHMIVLEYCHTDFSQMSALLGAMPQEVRKFYLAELILGMEFIHSKDLLHLDLKLNNLGLSPQGHLKILDFGLSWHVPTQGCFHKYFDLGQHLQFVAPEAKYMATAYQVGFPADIWSFGVIAFQMAYLSLPFPKKEKETSWIDESLVVEFPPNNRKIEDSIYEDLVWGCLRNNPYHRFSLSYLKAHDFFDGGAYFERMGNVKPLKVRNLVPPKTCKDNYIWRPYEQFPVRCPASVRRDPQFDYYARVYKYAGRPDNKLP